MTRIEGSSGSTRAGGDSGDRTSEWFVPRFGSQRFRCAIGMLFLPYTGMVLSFSIIGSILADHIYWDRVAAVVTIYFFGLGIGAHALDAIGSKGMKPWGAVFSNRQLWLIAAGALIAAYSIIIYYMVCFVHSLWVVAVLEGFFVFAYNLEWFAGRFHTDGWFAFSWGTLPVVMGFMIQTNRVSLEMLLLAFSMGILSLAEIKTSRPYKQLKRCLSPEYHDAMLMRTYEIILQCLSTGIIALGAGLLIWRINS